MISVVTCEVRYGFLCHFLYVKIICEVIYGFLSHLYVTLFQSKRAYRIVTADETPFVIIEEPIPQGNEVICRTPAIPCLNITSQFITSLTYSDRAAIELSNIVHGLYKTL